MNELEELELQLASEKQAVELRDLAIKLSTNSDFKRLIMDYFCKEECARYAQVSGDLSLPEENRTDALNIAQSAGHFRRWLSRIVQMGNQSENRLRDLEKAITEVRAEEV